MRRLAAAPARPEPLRPEQVTDLLGAAGAAPSIHNTQPWRFTVHDRTIEVYEDPRRGLPVHDPAGRQRLLSCGAAVTNLVAAALRLGLDPRVDSLPAGGPPGLLARVRLVDVAVAPGLHRGLADAATYRAIFTRRTYRREFAHQPLSESDRAALAAAATGPGVRWRWLSTPVTRHALELTRRAAALQRGDPAYRVELGQWLRYDAALPGDFGHRGHGHPVGFGDGIPVAALATGHLPLDGWPIHPLPVLPSDTADLSGVGRLALIATARDDRGSWLSAGRVMQHALLMATVRGLACSFLNQPIELPELRAELGAAAGEPYPQIVLRVGWPRVGVPAVPRRRTRDLVD